MLQTHKVYVVVADTEDVMTFVEQKSKLSANADASLSPSSPEPSPSLATQITQMLGWNGPNIPEEKQKFDFKCRSKLDPSPLSRAPLTGSQSSTPTPLSNEKPLQPTTTTATTTLSRSDREGKNDTDLHTLRGEELYCFSPEVYDPDPLPIHQHTWDKILVYPDEELKLDGIEPRRLERDGHTEGASRAGEKKKEGSVDDMLKRQVTCIDWKGTRIPFTLHKYGSLQKTRGEWEAKEATEERRETILGFVSVTQAQLDRSRSRTRKSQTRRGSHEEKANKVGKSNGIKQERDRDTSSSSSSASPSPSASVWQAIVTFFTCFSNNSISSLSGPSSAPIPRPNEAEVKRKQKERPLRRILGAYADDTDPEEKTEVGSGREDENERKILNNYYISTFGVSNIVQQCGIGARLLGFVKRSVLADPCSQGIYLHMVKWNTSALRLYLRCGFLVIRTLSQYYYLDDGYHHDALVLKLDLTQLRPINLLSAPRLPSEYVIKDIDEKGGVRR